MDPRLLKIGRIILIPIFFILLAWAYHDARNIFVTMAGSRVFERSLIEPWPHAFATLDKGLVLWHTHPYKKGAPMSILPTYTYRVQGVACSSNRFQFGPRKTAHTDIPAGDRRLNDMIKKYCPSTPTKKVLQDTVQYNYTCYPVQIFYDPQNVCLSYIAKPTNAEAVRAALRKSIGVFGFMIFFKTLAMIGCILGAWPLLSSGARRVKRTRPSA